MSSRLDDILARGSSLTSTQIETAKLWIRVKNGEFSPVEASQRRVNGPVTLGAYHRTLEQARSNFHQAVFTLLLGLRMGWIKAEDLIRLIEVVGKVPVVLDDEMSEQVISLLEALATKIVML